MPFRKGVLPLASLVVVIPTRVSLPISVCVGEISRTDAAYCVLFLQSAESLSNSSRLLEFAVLFLAIAALLPSITACGE